jgi:putative ATP-dependent endonuclease of the OLD family
MQIRLLTIQRYRGIETFTWKPNAGINCLIGPGDTFKSTVLAAISLLLAPYPLGACAEFDYYRRRISDGFEIEAYIGNLDLQALGTEQRLPHLFGWQNDSPAPLPEGGAEPVLRCRMRGNPDLELVYELPWDSSEQPPTFSAGLRRKLMLARLAGEERAARDLRLGTGSLLDRHLKTADMRAPVHGAIASATAAMEIPAPAEAALTEIRDTFRTAGLPTDLHLGLVPTQGAALVGMVALASGPTPTEAIPIANAGTGTRQMALLHLSAALAGTAPILVIDEPERGLEPYRQRSIGKKIAELAGDAGQAFLTTHAPAILQSLPADSVWRMRHGQVPLRFDGQPLTRLFRDDPDAFFALVPILCEGATEVGLLDELLQPMLARDLDGCGLRFVDGVGQPNVLDILDAFIAAGITCGAFLDNENTHTGRRTRITAQCTSLIWEGATNIEDAVCKWLPRAGLFALIPDAAQATDIESRYLEDQIYQYIPASDRLAGPRDLATAQYPEQILRDAFYVTMTSRSWFKSREGGRILARALNRVGMPVEIRRQFDDFGTRLRASLP